MPVMISQSLPVLASAKYKFSILDELQVDLLGGKRILSNEGNSSDGKEIEYYFKINTNRAQGNTAEGI